MRVGWNSDAPMQFIPPVAVALPALGFGSWVRSIAIEPLLVTSVPCEWFNFLHPWLKEKAISWVKYNWLEQQAKYFSDPEFRLRVGELSFLMMNRIWLFTYSLLGMTALSQAALQGLTFLNFHIVGWAAPPWGTWLRTLYIITKARWK